MTTAETAPVVPAADTAKADHHRSIIAYNTKSLRILNRVCERAGLTVEERNAVIAGAAALAIDTNHHRDRLNTLTDAWPYDIESGLRADIAERLNALGSAPAT